MSHRATSVVVVSLVSTLAFSRQGAAQTTADTVVAQGLFDDARELMSKGRYAEACPKLEESQRLDPGSGTLLNLASCYEQQGRVASAWSRFLEAAAAAKTTGNSDRETTAREHAAALAPRLGRIAIRVVAADKTAGVEVRRDGAVVGAAQWSTAIPADPGPHTVTATLPGKTPWQTTVTLQEGATVTVTVPEGATGKTPAGGSSVASDARQAAGLGTQRAIALVAGGVGLVGTVVGTVFFVQSVAKHEESQDGHCRGADCVDQTGFDLSNEARRAGNVATAAYIVGAVGLATGAALWFTAPQRGAQVGVGPGAVFLRASW